MITFGKYVIIIFIFVVESNSYAANQTRKVVCYPSNKTGTKNDKVATTLVVIQ